MSALLDVDRPLTLDDLAAIQTDVHSEDSHATAGAIASSLADVTTSDAARAFIDAIGAWEGHYTADSNGALAYQLALAELIDDLYRDRYSNKILGTIRQGPYVHDFVREDLADADQEVVLGAVERAAEGWSPGAKWGDLHRLNLNHPIGMIPVLGRPYRFNQIPYSGSTTTIFKAGHSVTSTPHNVTFVANARVLFDMGAIDDNRVVLLGGQDGWLGSDRFLDQLQIWRAGLTIPMPLSHEAQIDRAVRTTTLAPGAVR